jgi:two-component system chemotaxis sensor kinase CheA
VSELERIPNQIVARFRTVAMERLERIESGWLALTQRTAGPQTEAELFQDTHTLKGDARVVGFADVGLLSQRLEDLMFAARRRRFRVHEDVDMVVTMGIQFLRMLLRKRAGTSQGGIDLAGFLKHVDEVLAEWPRTTQAPDAQGVVPVPRAAEGLRIPPVVRQRLASVAASVYVEYLASESGSRSRARLRGCWEEIAKQLSDFDVVPLDPLLRRHAVAAQELAVELGKDVAVRIEPTEVRVRVDILDALNAALVHILRNAIDHGIEYPDVRTAHGKSRRAVIGVRVTCDERQITLVVEDDGAGVDLARVRSVAIHRGHMSGETAAAATDAELLRLLLLPGFSLRETVSAISGRGVGMDAVHAAVSAVKGTIAMSSVSGQGVTVEVRLPQVSRTIEVHRWPSAAGDATFAVPSTWSVRPVTETRGAVDPSAILGIVTATEGRSAILLQRDHAMHAVYVGGEALLSTATRICPTAPSEMFELVQLADDQHALLLRPETFFGQAAVSESA